MIKNTPLPFSKLGLGKAFYSLKLLPKQLFLSCQYDTFVVMKRDDTLWKGILEDLFIHFLRFFFEDADSLFDLKKGFEYLDKEMEQISKADDPQSSKFLDKLVKVYTKEGEEQWVLVHVEVQGYTDKNFEERIFVY